MTPQDFCYWLQGYYEMVGTYKLSDEQQKMVFEHHQLTFNKVTPTSIKKEPTITQQPNQLADVCPDTLGIPKFDKICSPGLETKTYDYRGVIDPIKYKDLSYKELLDKAVSSLGTGPGVSVGGAEIIPTQINQSVVPLSISTDVCSKQTNTDAGHCILMHPTCSKFHYLHDPNNTPEENKKMSDYYIYFDKNAIFYSSEAQNSKIVTKESDCENDKTNTKYYNEDGKIYYYKINEGSTVEEAKKDLFKHAILLSEVNQEYYRSLKTCVSC